MGYRSHVRICLLKENFKELKDKCKSLEYSLMDSIDFINADDRTIVFGWDWIKWYEEFDEVAAIKNYLLDLDDDVPYSFIRMCEDINDIEAHRHFCNGECYRIRPVTYIEVD